MALAIGPLLGGIITEHISWNWIFFVNVPIGVLAVLAAIFVVPESKDTSREQRLDLPGLATSGIGLLALVYALIEANQYGWTSARIVGLFVVAAVALTAFVLLELHQRLPMLDLSLFRNATFSGANTVMFLVGLAMFGIFFFNSLFLQNVLGYGAIKTGAVQARYVEVTKSSATPFANLAITFAVAGATTKRSTLCEKVIWAIGSGLSDE